MINAYNHQNGLNLSRLAPDLQAHLTPLYEQPTVAQTYLQPDQIYQGDARDLLPTIAPNSLPLSVWSPPYFVGKEYEANL